MKNIFITILDIVEFIIVKTNFLFYKEYCLKIEDYYYDQKKSMYIVVLRFRNKNAVVKSYIKDIIENKNLINSLHPYDSYLIGTIKTMQENGYYVNNAQVERDFDDYYIINPCVEWVGTDFTANQLIFKAKSSLSEIKISIEEFCKNAKLMRAIGSNSAFLIGSLVTQTHLQSAL